jgi:MerR family transcriptional regulator/heat shock protein HspR
MSEKKQPEEIDDEKGLYVISVAAELSGLHPQTLRQYDRLGLVSPSRTEGRNRRYSLRDIASLRVVQRLVGEGINHAGIKRIIELENAMANMAIEVAQLRIEVDALLAQNPAIDIDKDLTEQLQSKKLQSKNLLGKKKQEVIVYEEEN